MSYRRSFSKTVSIHYHGNISYPASQSGGSVSYSGTASENVTVNIDVDTNPFDRSIDGCNNSVNILTSAVVATEAAQVASIDSNAKKVAETIVKGFFGYIHSDISQQIMELVQKLESHLVHLRELAKRCIGKQQQMETDYNRISSRYLKIFDDLNSELSNRIFELDKPAFVFKNQIDKHAFRALGSDLVGTVAVSGLEGSELQAKISASHVKKRALDTIGKANVFLWKQKKLETTINQSMLSGNFAAVRYSPVCYIETQSDKGRIDRNVYQSDFLPEMQTNELIAGFQSQNWNSVSKENKDRIQRYFNAEVSNNYTSADPHENRVKENIVKMLNFDSIKSV